jgi:DNA-binding NtrC family response regulator
LLAGQRARTRKQDQGRRHHGRRQVRDRRGPGARSRGLEAGDGEPESLNLREVRQRAESKAIRVALTRSYGNISKAAELLGITRPTLYDLMNKYGLTAEAYSKKSVVNAN